MGLKFLHLYDIYLQKQNILNINNPDYCFFPEKKTKFKKPQLLVTKESNVSINHLVRLSYQSEFQQCMRREFISVETKTNSMKDHLYQTLNHIKYFK